MDGILPLWKPKGWTSHDCVMKVRRLLHTKKVGHTGTLDPDVEGVLPLCIGRATKIVPFLTDTNKVYEAQVAIGVATETEDASGAVIERKEPVTLEGNDIKQMLENFKGAITQIPPMYSAVKVNGKKLYEYAREGISVERPAREVYIHHIDFIEGSEQWTESTFRFSIHVICSKGTYIRTLCTDIGKAFGYPAHMSFLVRKQTGEIADKDCYTLDQIKNFGEQGRAEELLLPIQKGLTHLDSWDVDKETAWRIEHGQVLNEPTDTLRNPFCVTHQGEVLAIYQYHPEKPGKIKPVRVF
ncbi:tRNA pseudouridine(55) synthase TruB [Thalassobacillus pellis]|uniref:tRNA pseudouridine(55) synthase TruB n=1 Tax=Thalassobacillus pellis TaxID=748008 RepID=UPI0019601C10|nr:tRNA pseudouridine(55) synthase TruB [Thalassobacillus pellis]MBM7552705.1 tRNA pseudouridine55 synthase [Thalassobacillus pellis]